MPALPSSLQLSLRPQGSNPQTLRPPLLGPSYTVAVPHADDLALAVPYPALLISRLSLSPVQRVRKRELLGLVNAFEISPPAVDRLAGGQRLACS